MVQPVALGRQAVAVMVQVALEELQHSKEAWMALEAHPAAMAHQKELLALCQHALAESVVMVVAQRGALPQLVGLAVSMNPCIPPLENHVVSA